MEVSELTALVGETPVSLAEVEYVFRALVGYPDEEGGIEGATAENLMEGLQRCCNALIAADDQSELASALWWRVVAHAAQGKPTVGGSYASASVLIIGHQEGWAELFRTHANVADAK